MDENDETVKAAKLYLGMLDAGTFTQHKSTKKHLTKIIKHWLMFCDSVSELTELERLYDSFTKTEREFWSLMKVGRVVSFEIFCEGTYRSDHAVEKTLKNIRTKLDRTKYDFEISRSRGEVQWLIRDGKKLK
jgi:hypothetical protein